MIDPLSRLLAILALLGLAPTAAPAADAPQATLYTGAPVIDGTGGAARPDQAILVEGERIVASGPPDALANPAGRLGRAPCRDTRCQLLYLPVVDRSLTPQQTQ